MAPTHGGPVTLSAALSLRCLSARKVSDIVRGNKLTKDELRKQFCVLRRDQVRALPDSMRGLVFHRPPAPLLELIPDDAVIGLYRAGPFEAPAASYATFFAEREHQLTLPRFATRTAPMEFARFTDPYDESDLEIGPFGMLQPLADAPVDDPDVLIVPLVGFTAKGERLGQGGGHYDRWLATRPNVRTVGLGWDCQLTETLPTEPHDQRLDAVVTPTRMYGPFE